MGKPVSGSIPLDIDTVQNVILSDSRIRLKQKFEGPNISYKRIYHEVLIVLDMYTNFCDMNPYVFECGTEACNSRSTPFDLCLV